MKYEASLLAGKPHCFVRGVLRHLRKGNGTPGRIGVLRDVVRRWLKQRDEVDAICEPRDIDGGAGATIVRLRALPRRTDGDESETNRTNSAL